MRRFFCFICLAAFVATLGVTAGCSRQHYRKKADQEVYSVLRQGNTDPRWQIDDPRITPDSTSRMFMPFSPDREPMPHDDPTAHRKMHHVGGMWGSRDWHEHGCTRHTENPQWRQFLLVNERGEIPLNKEKAVELARLHAPEYQNRLESLYLAAMRVAQRRFDYDVRFFGAGSLVYSDGTSRNPTLAYRNSPSIRAERALASGGDWVVGLANTLTWTLTGQSSWRTNTLLNVGISQPLLRGASRKVVLESLTQEERNFLAELRRMALFQQGHYARIVTGTVPRNSGASGAGGGFYRLLESQIQIQNQRQNVISLEGSLSRFEHLFEAGQLPNISQVERTRQSLLNSQRQLLTQMNAYQANVESYISSLGLPPDLKITISDPLLEQFQLTSPSLTALTEDVGSMLAVLRQRAQPLPNNLREESRNFVRRAQGEITILQHDLDMLQRSVPDRIAGLRNLESVLAERIADGARIHPHVYDIGAFQERVDTLRTSDVPRTLNRLQASFTLLDLIASTEEQTLREMIENQSFDVPVQEALELLRLREDDIAADSDLSAAQQELAESEARIQALQEELGIDEPQEAASPRTERRQRGDEYRNWVRRVLSMFQNELVSLSLTQTRARLDAMTLVSVSVTPEEAFRVASENRLDWMNERSRLVDVWRQMDITADRLKGILNLDVNGGLGSLDGRGGNVNVGSNHSLDIALRWDSPLTRYNEMMAYRASQISYQRARRDYYTYVDSVHSDLRNVYRDVQMSQITFEINRNAVLVSTIQADVMQLQMEQPPRRGGTGIDTGLSEQLIAAFDALVSSQNQLLSAWVAFQTQRMLLDYHMGTMELDDRGRWIDPGMVVTTNPASFSSQEFSPLRIPVPIISAPAREVPRLSRRYVE